MDNQDKFLIGYIIGYATGLICFVLYQEFYSILEANRGAWSRKFWDVIRKLFCFLK